MLNLSPFLSNDILIIAYLDFWNGFPCSFFVTFSSKISSVGKYLFVICILETPYLMEKYHMCMWFLSLVLYLLPFSLFKIALLLSWYSTFSSTLNPCTLMKYYVRSIFGLMLWNSVTSLSVYLVPFIFYLFYIIIVAPLPRDIFYTVFPR